MTWNASRDLLGRIGEAYSTNASLLSSNKRVILVNSGSLTDASTMLDVIRYECAGNGYTRYSLSPSTGSYDASQDRYELPAVDATFTASGGSITYDTAAIISGASSTASKTVNTINATDNRLEFSSAHGLSNGDLVVVTADGGGTVPSELLNGGAPRLLYVVGSSDSGGNYWIQCSLTNGGSAIDFTGGSGTIRVRYANGKFDLFDPQGSTTIADGSTKIIRCLLNFGDGSADVNAA